MSINDSPRAIRLHIGIFGKTNSGKSSLLNVLTKQEYAVVSDVAGTTTDPVYKTMEIHGIGPVVFIDTAGFDDNGLLGKQRIEKTDDVLKKTDIAIIVIAVNSKIDEEIAWINKIIQEDIPFVVVINKIDIDEVKNNASLLDSLKNTIYSLTQKEPICISTKTNTGLIELKEKIIQVLPNDFKERNLTGDLCKEEDLVLLVMPQDIQAPKGRLILPQVQVLRELLDKKCLVMSCTTDKLLKTLDSMKNPPKLIITDSQVFKYVYDNKPKESLLTSFSVLLAANKGDIKSFIKGSSVIDSLTATSRVLIAEACTHAPLAEDIGREKIPRMLRNKYPDIQITNVSGSDFPKQLVDNNGKPLFDLIIHCGACMFNRSYMLSRQEEAEKANIPMTNYGIFIAVIQKILDKVVIPHLTEE